MADFVKTPIVSDANAPKIKTRTDTAGNEWQSVLIAYGAKDAETILTAQPATQATLVEAKDSLAAINAKFGALSSGGAPVTIVSGLSSIATQTTLVQAKDALDAINGKFAALSNGGSPVTIVSGIGTLATQNTLSSTKDSIDGLSAKFAAISNGGAPVAIVHPGSLATETTLVAVSSKLPNLSNSKLPTECTQVGTWNVQGSVAHDSVDANNPVKIGYKASTSLHSLTLVADADRTDGVAGVDGVGIVRLDSTLEGLISGNASNTDGTSTACIAAAGAGVKVYVTDITLTNSSATNVVVEIKEGTTTKWTFPVPANGGVTHSFRSPLAGTANTAWNFDGSAAATTLYCSMSGFKSKV